MLPIAISSKNAESAVGVPWRWLRDHAAELGVTIIKIGGKSMIKADDLLAALERRACPTTDEPQVDGDELARMRARIARAS